MSGESSDKRFAKEWELQRKGSPLGYFVLYTIIWAFILYIASLFFGLILRTIDVSFVVPVTRIVKFIGIGLLIAMATYYKGESRYYKIKSNAAKMPQV